MHFRPFFYVLSLLTQCVASIASVYAQEDDAETEKLKNIFLHPAVYQDFSPLLEKLAEACGYRVSDFACENSDLQNFKVCLKTILVLCDGVFANQGS